MKKIIYSILCGLLLLLTGCNKSDVKSDGIKVATDYISSLDSYELSCNMTVYRENKDIKLGVVVDYLKPSYYKVCFNNQSGYEQIIVKNDEGVFVLTPSLNKEFKFDSEWPLNSSHAYLLEGICKDIKADSSASFTMDGDTIIIDSKLSNLNNTSTKLRFYFDSKEKKPIKACLLDDNDNTQILVEFNEFTPNKALKKELFNTKLIMEEKTDNKENTNPSEDKTTSVTITAGYVCDGSTLSSSKIEDNSTILCYTGTKSYTIIVKKAEIYTSMLPMESYTAYDYLECGLLLYNDNTAKYYADDLEVCIYSSALTKAEFLSIASDITMS